jgi:ribonucleotide reductase beta subunit family protein with ferritin-like domain
MPANIRLDDDIQTYEQVLNQDKKDFPNNFWTGTDGKDRLKK